MSSNTSSSANTAMLALLRLSLVLIGTLASIFLLVHYGSALPFGKTAVYAAAVFGGIFMIAGVLTLVKELAAPAPVSIYKEDRPFHR